MANEFVDEKLLQEMSGASSSNTNDMTDPKLLDEIFSGSKQSINPNIDNAKKYVGNQDANDSYAGWCQKFTDDILNTPQEQRQSSALNTFQNNPNSVNDPSLKGIQPGDLVYFDAAQSNQGDGHVGFYEGNGKFISATDNGIVDNKNINEWNQQNNQSVLGYIPKR
jgi:hypothetical protein